MKPSAFFSLIKLVLDTYKISYKINKININNQKMKEVITMILVMRIILVILCIANAIIQKRNTQKVLWSCMALCWIGLCVDEIMKIW